MPFDVDDMNVQKCRRSGPLQYVLLLLVISVWVAWSLLNSLQVSNSHIDEEMVNHPRTKPSSNAKHERLRQQQEERLKYSMMSHTSDGMRTVGHFKSKSLNQHHQKLKAAASLNGASTPTYTKPYRPTIPAYQRKYPRVIFFVHIHKSAGTLFCRLAYRNRVNSKQEKNCNVQDDQHCCGGEDTMQAQIEFANHTYWDLVATERELYDSMAPDYYDYVVTLRDSKSRYYSHYSHLRRMMPVGPGIQIGGFGDSAWIYGNNSIVDLRIKKRILPPGFDPLGTFEAWYQGQPDNWNTRVLCGAKCRSKPKFNITQELFQYTLQRADHFKHFLFVEDIETSYNQIAEAYKWHKYADIVNTFQVDDHSNRRQNKTRADLTLKQKKWDPFMSALDDALYEFAKRKYLNVSRDELWKPFQNQEVVDRYFAEGHKKGCKNGCCGKCSSY